MRRTGCMPILTPSKTGPTPLGNVIIPTATAITMSCSSPSSGTGPSAYRPELLDRVVEEVIVSRFDHHDLNEDPAFVDTTTTGKPCQIDLGSAGG